jgi:hypothetical protein
LRSGEKIEVIHAEGGVKVQGEAGKEEARAAERAVAASSAPPAQSSFADEGSPREEEAAGEEAPAQRVVHW